MDNKYSVFYRDNLVFEFLANSDHAAKLRVSKFAADDVKLYSSLSPLVLFRDGVRVSAYVPFFFQWL